MKEDLANYDIYIVVLFGLFLLLIGCYTAFSVASRIKLKKNSNFQFRRVNLQYNRLSKQYKQLADKIEYIESFEHNKDLPYSELSKVYDLQMSYYEEIIANDEKLIDFLFEKFTIILKVTVYLIETYKRQIKGYEISKQVITNDITLAHKDIAASCIKILGAEFSQANSAANIEMLAHVKFDVLKIMFDKKKNSKVTRLIDCVSDMLAKTMKATILKYRELNPLQSQRENDVFEDLIENNQLFEAAIFLKSKVNDKQDKQAIIAILRSLSEIETEMINGIIAPEEEKRVKASIMQRMNTLRDKIKRNG